MKIRFVTKTEIICAECLLVIKPVFSNQDYYTQNFKCACLSKKKEHAKQSRMFTEEWEFPTIIEVVEWITEKRDENWKDSYEIPKVYKKI